MSVPPNWSSAKLRHLIETGRPITYGIVKPGDFKDDGIPMVRGGDYSGGWWKIGEIKKVSRKIDAPYKRSRIRGGDLVLTLVGANIGDIAMVPPALEGANISRTLARLSIDPEKSHPRFILHYFRSGMGKRLIYNIRKGGAQPGLNLSDVENLKISIPNKLVEQNNIVGILDTWDEAIEKSSQRVNLHAQLYSSLALQLFEEDYRSHNQLTPAKFLFEPAAERNAPELPLLAVMQDKGVIRRDELDRRVVMPDGDISNYKVVRPGDFVISLRSFEGGLELSNITGLVSPAYTVLRPKTEFCSNYYRHFFKARSFIGRLDHLIFGIRDGKQIAFRDFGGMKIPMPPLKDQERKAYALDTIGTAIRASQDAVNALKRQKRGLMQKLLTGEWRVPMQESDVDDVVWKPVVGANQ